MRITEMMKLKKLLLTLVLLPLMASAAVETTADWKFAGMAMQTKLERDGSALLIGSGCCDGF